MMSAKHAMITLAAVFALSACASKPAPSVAALIAAPAGASAPLRDTDLPPALKAQLLDGKTIAKITALRPPENFTYFSYDQDAVCTAGPGETESFLKNISATGGAFNLPANVHIRVVKPPGSMIWTFIETDDGFVGTACIKSIEISDYHN